eukprot:9678832-Alexandrium_andersonii.AAC.1
MEAGSVEASEQDGSDMLAEAQLSSPSSGGGLDERQQMHLSYMREVLVQVTDHVKNSGRWRDPAIRSKVKRARDHVRDCERRPHERALAIAMTA